jgi:hypothetical protein
MKNSIPLIESANQKLMSENLNEDVWTVVISFSDIFSIYKLTTTSKSMNQLKFTIDFQILLNFYFPKFATSTEPSEKNFSELLMKHNRKKKKIMEELVESQKNMVTRMNQFRQEFIIPLRSSKIVSPNDLMELIPINS